MITRSKAKAMEAQAKLNAPKRVPTLAPAQQPSAHVPAEIPQTRQPDQLRTSRRDHDQQQQHAELEAALLAAVMQMAVNPNQTEAQAGQQPINETAFYATAPRNQATTAACLDLMRTSGKITVQFLRVTLMACQAILFIRRSHRSRPTSQQRSRAFGQVCLLWRFLSSCYICSTFCVCVEF
jgi:hypothetical protein